MNAKNLIAGWIAATAVALPLSLYAADEVINPKDANPLKAEKAPKAVNPPMAAEPIKPGTVDKPPVAVAPGTMDTPPKPAAPGTLDQNVRNPDIEIRKGEKPVPK